MLYNFDLDTIAREFLIMKIFIDRLNNTYIRNGGGLENFAQDIISGNIL